MFDVLPLDINIAKMQFNLLNHLEREIVKSDTNEPIVESYKNKDKRVCLGEIKVSCKYLDNNLYEIVMIIYDNTGRTCCEDKFFCGTKEELIEYLKDSDKQFFHKVKELALSVSERNKTI